MRSAHQLQVRDKYALLVEMMGALAGNAHLSLEGNLSNAKWESIAGASREETETLQRNSVYPEMDFMVLPLEPETLDPIQKLMAAPKMLTHHLVYIQIEKQGSLEFTAMERFDPRFVCSGKSVPESLLRELVWKKVLDGYKRLLSPW